MISLISLHIHLLNIKEKKSSTVKNEIIVKLKKMINISRIQNIDKASEMTQESNVAQSCFNQ